MEAVAPHLFGNYYDAFLADIPWMTVLNSGRDPFFYSLYVGPLVLLLAATAIVRSAAPIRVLGDRRPALFMVASFGGYTPIYPLARKLLPPLAYFRFPVKYLVDQRVRLRGAGGGGMGDRPTSRRDLTSAAICQLIDLMRVARAAGLVGARA